jgi:hypothetical protein
LAPGLWSFLSIFTYVVSKLGIGSVSGLAAALDSKEDALGFAPENAAHKGQNNGYAALDNGGKVPANQLPFDILGLEKIKLNAYTNAAPNDGELWFDGTDLKFQKGGVTKTVTLT